MFESIDMTKTMYFSDGSKFDYRTAQKQLATNIGISAFSTNQDIETTLLNAVKQSASQLASGKTINGEDQKVMIEFYQWLQSIHNDKLVPPTGARFPNNIVYDLLATLRNKKNLSSEETLLRFFLEGANGRKISKGDTPSTDFIATSLILDVVNAAEKFGEISSAHQKFKKDYESIKDFSEPQRKLEAALTKLKENSVYALLTNNKVFEFEKGKNETTGAHCYLDGKNLEIGKQLLDKYEDKAQLAKELEAIVNSIKEIINKIIPEFVEAEKTATESATLLAKWDASEWIERINTMLRLARHMDIKYGTITFRQPGADDSKQIVVETQSAAEFYANIVKRNETGDYPAIARNNAIESLDITQFFTQAKFAQAATSSSKYTPPKDSPVSSTSTNSQGSATNSQIQQEVTNTTTLSNSQ